MKQGIKKIISSGLVFLGKIKKTKEIPILTYHSVDSTNSVISISPKAFRAQINYLSDKGYRTISLNDFLNRLARDDYNTEKLKEVVLTFDDGFKNNYTEVLPILTEFNFTATIFLTTGFLNKMCTWEREKSIGNIPLLNWKEIREMDRYGIEFGAHTVNHVDLTSLGIKEAEKEITDSKKIIEDKLGKTVHFFCYPFGRHNDTIDELVAGSGFKAGCTTRFKIKNCYANRYALSRIGTSRFSSLVDFKAGILGTYGFYEILRNSAGVK